MKVLLSEIIEPLTPKGVKHTRPVHNKGTNTAIQLEKYTYYTTNGNKVEIICKPQGTNRYDISFAVNGNLKNDKNFFDREVLKTVFTMLPKIADNLKMEEISIESFTDDYDTKVYKNLPDADLLNELIKQIKTAIEIYERNLQKTVGQIKNYYEQELHMLKYYLNFLNNKEGYKWEYSSISELTRYIKNEDLETLYKKYRHAILSQRSEGVSVTGNRRHKIYQNLLPKFMPNWNIKDHSNMNYFAFTLTRKP